MAVLQRQPTDAEEAAFASTNPGRVTSVGDTTGGSAGLGKKEPNEFVLWNYQVGGAGMRPEHIAEISKVAARWRPLLTAQPSQRVKVVGSASTSGGAQVNTALARKRSEAVKEFLVSRGIPDSRVDVDAVGSRQPLADSRTAAGMARNRRVELFLFRPTALVDDLVDATADVASQEVNIGSTFNRTLDPSGKFLALRHVAMRANAQIEGSGRAGSEVGYLQFVRDDRRVGRYVPIGGGAPFSLDFSRCTKPFLPCKDVAEATAVFSSPPLALLPGPVTTSGTVEVADQPGVAFPIEVLDPRRARLDAIEWSMEFVCVLGIRSGEAFTALDHFIWRVDAVHTKAADASPQRQDAAALVAAGVPGSPPSLDVDSAMGGRTCRFTMRRLESTGSGDPTREMCQPELAT
jgi:outer membrane protein OmpA-like peptidoglycan-associated protein